MSGLLGDFDPTKEFKTLISFRADGAIWQKLALFAKERVEERILKMLYEQHKIAPLTDDEAQRVAASTFSPKHAPGMTEVIPPHPELVPETPDEKAARIAGMTVANLSQEVQSLDFDMLARVRAAESAKPDDAQRTSALAAIDAATAKLTQPAIPVPDAAQPAPMDNAGLGDQQPGGAVA